MMTDKLEQIARIFETLESEYSVKECCGSFVGGFTPEDEPSCCGNPDLYIRADKAREAILALQADRERALEEALDREEKYLIDTVHDEDVGGVMQGDVEGAFHRIRASLRAPVQGEANEEWCVEAAKREGDSEVGAGFNSLPEAIEALPPTDPAPAQDVVERGIDDLVKRLRERAEQDRVSYGKGDEEKIAYTGDAYLFLEAAEALSRAGLLQSWKTLEETPKGEQYPNPNPDCVWCEGGKRLPKKLYETKLKTSKGGPVYVCAGCQAPPAPATDGEKG